MIIQQQSHSYVVDGPLIVYSYQTAPPAQTDDSPGQGGPLTPLYPIYGTFPTVIRLTGSTG